MNGQEEEQQSPAGSAVGELGRTGIKNLVSTLGRKFGGKALGSILGSVIPGLGNLAGAAIGAALDMLHSLFKAPEKILGIGLGTVIGCLSAMAIVVVVIIMVPIMVLLFGFGGVVSPAEPDPVEPPPIPGDGTGLVADYCVRVPIPGVPPPYPDAVTDEEKCSQKLRDLFIAAGKWAQVPAGVIAGVAKIEGRQIFGYTDELIEKYSAASGGSGIDGQAIDPANSTPNSCSAIGPMQMTVDYDSDYPPVTFSCGDVTEPPYAWNTYKTAANKADVTSTSNPDARNIRNAVYGAAWMLKCMSWTPTDECKNADFSQYDYDDPENATDDDWEGPPGEFGEADGSKGEVWRAAKGYYGSCGNNYCQDVWEYYQATKDTSAVGGAPWGWPTSGMMSQGPFESKPSHGEMSAIDFGHRDPQPVYTTHGGNVIKYPDNGNGYGNYVEVYSSNYITRYAHFNEYSKCLQKLPNNWMIKAGTYLGNTGWTGYVDPPGPGGRHLHYQIMDHAGFDLDKDLEEFNRLIPQPYSKGTWVEADYSGSECIEGP